MLLFKSVRARLSKRLISYTCNRFPIIYRRNIYICISSIPYSYNPVCIIIQKLIFEPFRSVWIGLTAFDTHVVFIYMSRCCYYGFRLRYLCGCRFIGKIFTAIFAIPILDIPGTSASRFFCGSMGKRMFVRFVTSNQPQSARTDSKNDYNQKKRYFFIHISTFPPVYPHSVQGIIIYDNFQSKNSIPPPKSRVFHIVP